LPIVTIDGRELLQIKRNRCDIRLCCVTYIVDDNVAPELTPGLISSDGAGTEDLYLILYRFEAIGYPLTNFLRIQAVTYTQ
jgi:hypothetical protein